MTPLPRLPDVRYRYYGVPGATLKVVYWFPYILEHDE